MATNISATIFLVLISVAFAPVPPPVATDFEFTSTQDQVALVVTQSDGSNFVVGNVAIEGNPPATISPDPLPTTAAASVNINVTGLSPATLYIFLLSGLTDGSSPLETATASDAACTKPEPVSGLMVVEAETNTTQIKLSWTSPVDSTPVTMEVLFDDYATQVPDPSSTEYILTESASGVALTADQSGTCKVKLTVAGGEACATETSEVEIDCAASDPPASDGSAVVKLLPGTLLLCLVYQILAA